MRNLYNASKGHCHQFFSDIEGLFSPEIIEMAESFTRDCPISQTTLSNSFFDEPFTTHKNILTSQKRQCIRSTSPSNDRILSYKP